MGRFACSYNWIAPDICIPEGFLSELLNIPNEWRARNPHDLSNLSSNMNLPPTTLLENINRQLQTTN